MNKFLMALPLCTAMLFGGAAFAQDTGTASEGSTTTQEQPKPQEPNIADQLSMGEDGSKDPEMGKPFTKETIGKWEMRCIKFEDGKEPCQMYQMMDDGQGNPVAEISIFRLPDGNKAKAGATVIVPLETSLPQQLLLSVDGGKPRRYPYAFCNPVGCYVRMGLTEADVNALKRGNEAQMTIVPALAPDQKVVLKMSLDGFTASYDKASVVDN